MEGGKGTNLKSKPNGTQPDLLRVRGRLDGRVDVPVVDTVHRVPPYGVRAVHGVVDVLREDAVVVDVVVVLPLLLGGGDGAYPKRGFL